MNTSFFGELLQTITERGRALIERRHEPPGLAYSEGLAELCEQLLSIRGEGSGVALAREILARYDELKTGPRIAFFETLLSRFRPDRARIEAALEAWQRSPSDTTVNELHKATEPRRQELFRRLNLAPRGTAWLVHMREQLLDAMVRRPELAPIDTDFRHLFAAWFNRSFLVLRRIDWSTPAAVLEKIILAPRRYIRSKIGTICAPACPPAGPALLRLFPSGAGRRPVDLRRGGAHARDSGRDRADSRGETRSDPSGPGDHGGVVFDLQLPARPCRHHLWQFPDQTGRGGDIPRFSAALELRDAFARSQFRRVAQARARRARIARATGSTRAPLARLDQDSWWTDQLALTELREPMLRAGAT